MSNFRKSIQFWIVFVVLANTYLSTCIPAHGTEHYLAHLQRKIRKAEIMPKRITKTPVKVRFTIALDGELIEVKVSQSCGLPDCDKAALETKERAAPFDALPQGATEPVEIEYTFDYVKEKEERLKQAGVLGKYLLLPETQTKKGAK